MKPIIKYISLLLFSGLILPFCSLKYLQTAKSLPAEKTAQTTKDQHEKAAEHYPYICPEVLETLFPVFKK